MSFTKVYWLLRLQVTTSNTESIYFTQGKITFAWHSVKNSSSVKVRCDLQQRLLNPLIAWGENPHKLLWKIVTLFWKEMQPQIGRSYQKLSYVSTRWVSPESTGNGRMMRLQVTTTQKVKAQKRARLLSPCMSKRMQAVLSSLRYHDCGNNGSAFAIWIIWHKVKKYIFLAFLLC